MLYVVSDESDVCDAVVMTVMCDVVSDVSDVCVMQQVMTVKMCVCDATSDNSDVCV